MAEQLKIGMIGCGGISGSHLPNILKTPEMRLIATMDLVEEAERPDGRRYGARVRAEEGNAEYYTTDMDRVLSDPDIDAVMIFLPTPPTPISSSRPVPQASISSRRSRWR
jgi:predicted dehydrogenase